MFRQQTNINFAHQKISDSKQLTDVRQKTNINFAHLKISDSKRLTDV